MQRVGRLNSIWLTPEWLWALPALAVATFVLDIWQTLKEP